MAVPLSRGAAPAIGAAVVRRSRLGRFFASFRHAARGLSHLLETQLNAKVHAAATICVIIVALWLRLSIRDLVVLGIAVTLVWAAEAFNTAVEATVDLITAEFRPLARIAKDTAAAGVLICAIGAGVVGALVLGPPLWQRIVSGPTAERFVPRDVTQGSRKELKAWQLRTNSSAR